MNNINKKANSLEVICIGAAIVDIPLKPVNKNIFDTESYPLDQISMTIGGDAINEATIISRLNHKVALLSMVGNDIVGSHILKHCNKEGIDTSGVRVRDDIDTSINIGLIAEDGERTFLSNRNGSLWKMIISDLDLNLLVNAKILSFASYFNSPLLNDEAITTIFEKAKLNNMLICADMIKPRFGEELDSIKKSLSYVDYFFPNYEEAKLMTGESELSKICDRFQNYGVKNAIIKTGKSGAFVKTVEKEEFFVPAMKGITAVDTTGAGDNFASGFIVALLEGKDIYQAVEYAHVTAGISVQSIGATTGLRNREEWNKQFKIYQEQFPERQ